MLGWSDKGDNTEKGYEHDVVHGGECFVLSGVPSEQAAMNIPDHPCLQHWGLAIQEVSNLKGASCCVHHSQAAALVSVY